MLRGKGWVSVKSKRGYKRGYSVAVLVGLEESGAVLWRVFSNLVKHERNIRFGGVRSDLKALYNFHEAIIDALRPVLREGVRSIVLASPAKSGYGKSFIVHVQQHHAWLVQGLSRVSFSEVASSACMLPEVASLVKSSGFRRLLSEAVLEESEVLVELLEKRLNATSRDALVFYSLVEIEDLIFSQWLPGKPKPEFLLLTDSYLAGCREKGRLQRLMQVVANRGVKTRIVAGDSPAGKRVAQLGGMVLLASVA